MFAGAVTTGGVVSRTTIAKLPDVAFPCVSEAAHVTVVVPSGKVEPDEDPRATVVRELREELGIEVEVGDVVEATFHRYREKTVLLLFYEAGRKPGSPAPRALDVADFRWAGLEDLADEAFPPADVPVLTKVRARLRSPRA